MMANAIIEINAHELGYYAITEVGKEYYQVYKRVAKTTWSWLDNCESIADALAAISDHIEGNYYESLTRV